MVLNENSPECLEQGIIYIKDLDKDTIENIKRNSEIIIQEFDYNHLSERFLYVVEKTLYGSSRIKYKVYKGEEQ